MFYSPVTKEYIDIQDLQTKFNTCIPANTKSFRGYNKVYPSIKPEISRFQEITISDPIFKNGKFYENFKVIDIPLEDARNILLEEATNKYNEIKNNKNLYTESSLGIKINCNADSLTNILQLSLINKDIYTFITYDNKEYVTTKENIDKILQEISNAQEKLFMQKQNYKSKINKAESIKELEKININYSLE